MARPHPFLVGSALAALLASPAFGASGRSGGTITLEPLGSYRERVTVGGQQVCRKKIAEIIAYDRATRRLFVTNIADLAVDVLDLSDPGNPTRLRRVELGRYGAPTSVAARHGLVAVATAAVRAGAASPEPGRVVLLDGEGRVLRALSVGVTPDMLTFTPDGRTLLVANGGAPSDDYRVDPEGSVTVIRLKHGWRRAEVETAGFRGFDAAALRAQGVRIFGPGASAARDLAPEYIAVAADSRRAWVTLQPNNALGILDIAKAEIERIVALGVKRHDRPGQGLDASDKDGQIAIRRWPVQGVYEPDGIAAYRHAGRTYLVLADEGEPRSNAAFDETARVRDLRLDPGMFPNATALQADERLGRLVVSTVAADLDGDGDVDRLRTLGGRSFSIRRADGSLVHDSGDLIERYTAQDALYAPAPNLFNTPDDENSFDERSDNRGPQPDNVAVARIHGRSYAFVALERTSIVLVVDVTHPERPMLLGHAGTRDFTEDPKATGGADTGLYVNCAAGDLGPEGLLVIPADESPVGAPLLVVGYQTSGSTRVFRIAAGRRGGR
jgi:hypothetical protein